ncbi:MAG: cysteine hydrolase [Cellulosilyticum sp.]|nr:cysteine hydrolase [Cellulosilyticum sp.]
MTYDALIIIDMQTALIEGHPYNETKVVENIKSLITSCRQREVPVIYVRHDGGVGDELEKGTKGWEVFSKIAPLEGEKIFDKNYNSAFRHTGLHEYLQEIGAKQIIMCGMQTEYCFDVSCKVAFEYGYQVTIVKDTTTTFDNAFATGEALSKYYEEKIWHNRYAQVVSIEEVLLNM